MPVVYANVIDAIGRKLYTGDIVWIREYIQNAIDADAKRIVLEVEGRDLKITDDGGGMGLDEINEQLFSIGGSEKSLDKIGQFGIGMYAGSGVCDKISVRTRKKGFPIYLSEIDMKKYKEELGMDESGQVSKRKLFEEVIPRIFTLKKVDDPTETRESFTEIKFSDVDVETIKIITKKDDKTKEEGKRLKEVLIDYVPVPISKDFQFAEEIKQFLKDEDVVDISVIIDGKRFSITKFENINMPFLNRIITKNVTIEGQKGQYKLIAKIWAAYSATGKSLRNRASLLVKFKGMSVGDKTVITSRFHSKDSKRYIGEIVVKDFTLQLNTERNWFLDSLSLDTFVDSISKELNKLYDIANFDSKLGNGLRNKISKLQDLNKRYSDELRRGNSFNARMIELDINNLKPKIEERVKEFQTVGRKLETDLKNEQDPYSALKADLINSIGPALIDINAIKREKEVSKPTRKPWDATSYVRTVLENYVVDKRLREVAAQKNSKDTLTNLFTLIDTTLKERAGINRTLPVGREEDLINAFFRKNRPPEYVPQKLWEDYYKDFKNYVLSLYGLFRNEAVHTFIEHFDNDRNNLQFLLMGDLLLEIIDSWIPRDPSKD